MTSHVHGQPTNRSTYLNHGCRCTECKQAATEYTRQWRAKKPMAARRSALVQRLVTQKCIDACRDIPGLYDQLLADAKTETEQILIDESEVAS